jgi:hypothetical protein
MVSSTVVGGVPSGAEVMLVTAFAPVPRRPGLPQLPYPGQDVHRRVGVRGEVARDVRPIPVHKGRKIDRCRAGRRVQYRRTAEQDGGQYRRSA